jgi:hypothetical protein
MAEAAREEGPMWLWWLRKEELLGRKMRKKMRRMMQEGRAAKGRRRKEKMKWREARERKRERDEETWATKKNFWNGSYF